MKENFLILGGYSKVNLNWIENMSKVFSTSYNSYIIKYDNWYNGLEMNFDKEIDKIYNMIKQNNVTNIIAKSIGIYLIIELTKKYDIKFDNVVFMGYPLKVLNEDNINLEDDITKLNTRTNLTIIQQENDILCSYDELIKIFTELNLIKINGSDHSYSNYDDLKTIVTELLNNKVKTIIHNNDNLSNEEITELVIRAKALIINDKNEILIANENNVFEFPGGHLEENETLENTLKREILEETGIELDNEIENYFFKVIFKNRNWPMDNKNRMCEIYYYVIKTNKLPNFDNINLTQNELKNNFKVDFYKLDDVKNILLDNLKNDERNKSITPDMICAIDEYLRLEKANNLLN